MSISRLPLGAGVACLLASTSFSASALNESGRAVVGTPVELAFRYESPALLPITTAYSTSAPTNVPSIDPRIDDLADSLNNDVDRIYEYVRNSIETTPAYGLSKGAFGAMLDGAGTPFDQADLMVQLVRAAGGTANYVTGNVTVDGQTFTEWFGPTTNRGACELLAAGGIPATVSGGSGSDCANYSGAIGNVTFAHAWVQANVGGTNYYFDPSFKRSNWYVPDPAIDNAVSAPSNWRNAGGTAGTTSGVAHRTGYTVAARNTLRSTLDGFAASIASGLTTTEANGGYEGRTASGPNSITPSFSGASPVSIHIPQSMAEASGGFELIAQPMYHASHYPRHTAYTIPGATTASASSVQTFTTLPASMRTYVRFFLTTGIQGVADTNTGPIDASILAGRRIASTRGLRVTVDEANVIGQPSGNISGMPDWAIVHAFVVIDHPYGGTTGTQSDATYQWRISNGMPFYYGLSFGSRGNGAELRNTAVINQTGLGDIEYASPCSGDMAGGGGGLIGFAHGSWSFTPINGSSPTCQSPGNGTFCPITGETALEFEDRAAYVSRLIFQMPARQYSVPIAHQLCGEAADSVAGWGTHPERQGSKVAALESFLTQSSRLLDVYEGLAGGRRVQHHMVGVSSMNLIFHARGYVAADNGVIDFGGRFGYAGLDNEARGRRAFAFATAYAMAALERQVLQAQSDAVSVNGAAAMFDWFISHSGSLDTAFTAGFANRQIRFFDIEDATDRAAVDSLLLQGADRYNLQGQYINAGYDLVLPQSLRLGPARLQFRNHTQFPGGTANFTGQQLAPQQTNYIGANDYELRGQSFLAYRETAGEIAIAPIAGVPCQQATGCYSGLNKGAGGGNFPSGIEPPVAGREELDERYESWATAFNVDLRTGGLTLTPPPDITDGAGDYPYSLGFQRTYSSDRGANGPLGWGWTHNFDVSLSTSTNIGAALGEQSWTHATATLTVAEALLSLFDDPGVDLLRDSVTAQMALAWWSDLVFDNQASIQRGTASERFYWAPGASSAGYQPEPGSTAMLTRSGSRQTWYLASTPTQSGYSASHPDSRWASVSEAFDRRHWDFTYTNGSGVSEVFDYRPDYTQGDYEPSDFEVVPGGAGTQYFIGSVNRFRPVSTVFPFGITVRYVYDANHNLTEVRSEQTTNSSLVFSRVELAYETNPNSGYQPDQPNYLSDIGYGPRFRLLWVQSDMGRAEFGYANAPTQTSQLTAATNVMNEDVTYSWDDIEVHSSGLACSQFSIAPSGFECTVGARLRMTGLRLPHAPSSDFLSFAYDSEARTRVVTTPRAPSFFDPGNGSRSSSRDGSGWRSWNYYDRDGRLTARVNPALGITETDYDARGRTIGSRTGYAWDPVLQRYDRHETWYNARNNPVVERERPYTDASGNEVISDTIDVVSEYGYASFPDLVTRTLDPRGNATRYCYHSSQSIAGFSCSAVQSSGHDGLLRGTYGPSGEETLIDYDAAGRVTRQRVRAD